MINKYKAGANFERRLVKKFLADGASWSARTAGSHSAIDVCALFDTHFIGCQCQINLPFSVGKKQALIEALRGKEYCEGYLVWRDKNKIVMERVV